MPEPAPQKTPNSLLKQTREAKGLTLDIVHEATKIPMDALKAIEEGYSVRILTPFYYRGFLKIYAEFLGLDPLEVLSHYEVQKPTKPVVVKPSRSYQPKNNELLEGTGEFLAKAFSSRNCTMIFRLAAIALAIFVVLKIGGCALGALKKHSSAKPAATAKKTEKAKPRPVEAKAEAEPDAQTVKAQVFKFPGDAGKVSLAIRAVKDTWVQVKADGNIVFEMKMKKGTMESWSAKNKIELSGKNVSELDLEVNGDHIGPLGSAERGAKKVLITKEGLTVKK